MSVDVEKLKLKSSEIDRNTGRIVLPSKSELDDIMAAPGVRGREAAAPAQVSPVPLTAPQRQHVAGIPLPSNQQRGEQVEASRGSTALGSGGTRGGISGLGKVALVGLLALMMPLLLVTIYLLMENRSLDERLVQMRSERELELRRFGFGEKPERSLRADSIRSLEQKVERIGNELTVFRESMAQLEVVVVEELDEPGVEVEQEVGSEAGADEGGSDGEVVEEVE